MGNVQVLQHHGREPQVDHIALLEQAHGARHEQRYRVGNLTGVASFAVMESEQDRHLVEGVGQHGELHAMLCG